MSSYSSGAALRVSSLPLQRLLPFPVKEDNDDVAVAAAASPSSVVTNIGFLLLEAKNYDEYPVKTDWGVKNYKPTLQPTSPDAQTKENDKNK